MGPIIRHSVIDAGMEVVVFVVQDPDMPHDRKVDAVQENEVVKLYFKLFLNTLDCYWL